ncbi:MAG: hypothetical protein WBE46_08065 [Dehalococcoidia bacterium]
MVFSKASSFAVSAVTLSRIRTFFFAQGIPREQLPFQYRSIRISDEDCLMRKAMRFDRVADFISKGKHSGNARACFYGVLATIWAFRPIEMGGKFSSITPKRGAI